jgi:hypothetical protein
MRKYLHLVAFVALLALAILSGCGKRPNQYGNFAEADSVELVRDAMSALLANYPPAKTRLALVQETEDAFGASLVETMRAHGYAVAEYAGPARSDKYQPAVRKPDGSPFAYLLDGKGDELRMSLHVGVDTLSRLYRVQRSGDTLHYTPQGFWSRKQ